MGVVPFQFCFPCLNFVYNFSSGIFVNHSRNTTLKLNGTIQRKNSLVLALDGDDAKPTRHFQNRWLNQRYVASGYEVIIFYRRFEDEEEEEKEKP